MSERLTAHRIPETQCSHVATYIQRIEKRTLRDPHQDIRRIFWRAIPVGRPKTVVVTQVQEGRCG
jgi:hypothetical protein